MKKNVIVAQSGGPSPVINSSLLGIIEACRSRPDVFGRIFAAWHGVEGILKEELLDIDAEDDYEISLLKHTPASGAIGTCRYKLNDSNAEDFERIIDVCRAQDVGWFFYIGGNDSMDTASKVARLAKMRGFELIAAGVPKTIDNDIGDDGFTIIDHTPGYGSAARYWSHIIQEAGEENRAIGVSEPVAVFQAMGRTSGYIPASARLADPNREMPLQLYLAETEHNLESLADNVNRMLLQRGRCIVVASEGFNVGTLGEARDGFGHIEYGASESTVAQKIVNHLNSVGLKARGQATGQVPGILQRSTSLLASTVDIEEAYQVGRKAVEVAVEDGSGWMSTILRDRSVSEYRVYYDKVELEKAANVARQLPKSWISEDGLDVTDDFIDYALPLIGNGPPKIPYEDGLMRFTRFKRVFKEKKAPDYIPVNMR
ncbi:MAG: diphosphate--fructose-6-phosphate 1-phosphotransferase [Spirochaetales bacterium]|nr:diphosphate--fructose-6-phosphate 1-phosphotransferase [Spirochaetales bacterium]